MTVPFNPGADDRPDYVIGDHSGLSIPVHGEAMKAAGDEWLTRAFRSFGALDETQTVRLTDLTPCPGGSTGKKFFLTVAYDAPVHHLPTRLFVKFSRDFDDPVRDGRGKYEMEGEVAFAHIASDARFPVTVPLTLFADYDGASKSGLLITETIPFGEGAFDPHHEKCMDHKIADPLLYYRLIFDALARIAGSHRAGRLGDTVDTAFPYAPPHMAKAAGLRIVASEEEIEAKIADFSTFASDNARLFPTEVVGGDLFDDLRRHAPRFVRHQGEIARFLTEDADMVALCHWNANIDNCFFWRDEVGALRCGLMDWGNAGQINIAFALWGSLSGATLRTWNTHFDELTRLFIETYEAVSGETLPRDRLLCHLDLYIAIMGLSYFLDSPARIRRLIPDLESLDGPLDPRLLASETARNQLSIATNFLNYWRMRRPVESLDQILG